MTHYSDRPYGGADDLQQMQTMIGEAWASAGERGYMHPGDIPHRIYNGMRRYNASELVHLWHDATGKLAGFAMLYPHETGIDVMVRPDLRGQPIEETMLTWALTTCTHRTRQLPEPATHIVADWWEGETTRLALLAQHGFQQGELLMIGTRRDLDTPIPEPVLPPGWRIRPAAGVHEAGLLAAVHSGSFGSNWTPESYAQLMQSPGYDPERELVVETAAGEFAAFCIIWPDPISRTGLFEPVGVVTDYQQRGLGKAVMRAGLARLQAAGMRQAIVWHEADNPAAAGLYQSMGFVAQHKVYNGIRPLEWKA